MTQIAITVAADDLETLKKRVQLASKNRGTAGAVGGVFSAKRTKDITLPPTTAMSSRGNWR